MDDKGSVVGLSNYSDRVWLIKLSYIMNMKRFYNDPNEGGVINKESTVHKLRVKAWSRPWPCPGLERHLD